MNISFSQLLTGIVQLPKHCRSLAIQSLTNDSREVTSGTLFLAFPGTLADGRNYIESAIQKDAVAILYDDQDFVPNVQTDIPLIPLTNLKNYQADIAARFYQYPSSQLDVIGVTGTNGKTSVTHFIAQAMLDKTAVIGTTGYGFLPDLIESKNTTPDPVRLQKMIADCVNEKAAYLAMEVSSHGLVEKRMAHVAFHTAVFTNLTREHLDFHGTMAAYRDAKLQLFLQPGLKHAVINIDSETGQYYVAKTPDTVRVLTYSASGSAQADIYVTDYEPTKKGFSATLVTPWGSGSFESQLIGYFNLENVLAVVGVLGVFNIPLPVIFDRLSQLQPVPGRMMLYHQDHFPTVAIDYAHTPDALENALKALKQHCHGKLWCVFGCGGDRDAGKRPEMGAIAEQLSDHVIVTNDNPRSESPASIAQDILAGIKNQATSEVILDREQAIVQAIHRADEQDLILLAGKGHEVNQVIGDQVLPFSDVQVVQQCFMSKKHMMNEQ